MDIEVSYDNNQLLIKKKRKLDSKGIFLTIFTITWSSLLFPYFFYLIFNFSIYKLPKIAMIFFLLIVGVVLIYETIKLWLSEIKIIANNDKLIIYHKNIYRIYPKTIKVANLENLYSIEELISFYSAEKPIISYKKYQKSGLQLYAKTKTGYYKSLMSFPNRRELYFVLRKLKNYFALED